MEVVYHFYFFRRLSNINRKDNDLQFEVSKQTYSTVEERTLKYSEGMRFIYAPVSSYTASVRSCTSKNMGKGTGKYTKAQ